jgi:hypothetical protein
MVQTKKTRGGTKNMTLHSKVRTSPGRIVNSHTLRMKAAFNSQEEFAKQQLKMKRKNDIKQRIEKLCLDIETIYEKISNIESKSKRKM